MIVVMGHAATLKQISDVIQHLDQMNIRYHVSRGEERTVIGLLGDTSHISREAFLDLEGCGRSDSHYKAIQNGFTRLPRSRQRCSHQRFRGRDPWRIRNHCRSLLCGITRSFTGSCRICKRTGRPHVTRRRL